MRLRNTARIWDCYLQNCCGLPFLFLRRKRENRQVLLWCKETHTKSRRVLSFYVKLGRIYLLQCNSYHFSQKNRQTQLEMPQNDGRQALTALKERKWWANCINSTGRSGIVFWGILYELVWNNNNRVQFMKRTAIRCILYLFTFTVQRREFQFPPEIKTNFPLLPFRQQKGEEAICEIWIYDAWPPEQRRETSRTPSLAMRNGNCNPVE